METETLFTTSKWDILQHIASKPSAPLEIAKALGTTTANISQQLRLLEAAGLVAKTRVVNTQAGKPRALFSLTKDFALLTTVAKGEAKKKLISLSPLQVAIMRLWLLEDFFDHQYLIMFLAQQDLATFGEIRFKEVKGDTIELQVSQKTGAYPIKIGTKTKKIVLTQGTNKQLPLLLQ